MKISTRILGLLATAVVGLTLTSCGGGGGGGGGNGGGANGSSEGSSANTGLAPASLAGQQWIMNYNSMTQLTLTFSSGNKVIIKSNFQYNGQVYSNEKSTTGTYTYDSNGNKAVLNISGKIPYVRQFNSADGGTITWDSVTTTLPINLNFYSKYGAYIGTSSEKFIYNQG